LREYAGTGLNSLVSYLTQYSDFTILVPIHDRSTVFKAGNLGRDELKDLRAFPEAVQDLMGYALYVAQRGGKHQDAKVLSGLAARES